MLKWLRDNDFINNSDVRTTHTLMTGGVVGVPDERYDEFLSLYATEVKSGNKTLSFSELRSDPIFCMYFDVDLLDTCVTSGERASRIFTTIQSVVKTYYTENRDDERFRCVICDTASKDVTYGTNENARTLTKSGYHVTFPNLRVTLHQALQIRHSVVYELEKTLGPRPDDLNAWSDVIDKAPYTTGLKMCGSFKCVRCSDCKKSDSTYTDKKKAQLSAIAKLRKKIHPRKAGFDYSDLADIHEDEFKDALFGELYGKYLEFTGFNSCRSCLNTGKIMENRTYMPSIVLDGEGHPDTSILDVFKEDYYEVMKYTSIRCQQGENETTGYAIPKGVPKAPTEGNGANMRSFNSKKLVHLGSDMHAFTVNNDLYLSDAQSMHLWEGPRVQDQRILSVIEEFIRGSICGAYSAVQIRKVCKSRLTKKVTQRSSSGSKLISSLIGAHSGTTPPSPAFTVSDRYLVNIAGVGSTYCMNKGDEHNSNSVYFIITQEYCYQKCFSRKPEVRAGGTTCAEYRSGGVRVPVWVSSVLFPGNCDNKEKALAPVGRPASKSNGSFSAASGTKRKKKRSKIDWGMMKL